MRIRRIGGGRLWVIGVRVERRSSIVSSFFEREWGGVEFVSSWLV